MTIEKAIHELWSGYRPLAVLVPPERIYTGLPPIRSAARQPVAFPYVALAVLGEAYVIRTSSGTTLAVERLRFSIYSKCYDEGRRIALAICNYFNRREFPCGRGRVLDMKPGDRTEAEDPTDGVWLIARDFYVRFSDTSGAAIR